MSHDVVASSTPAETSMGRSETLLLAVLLSRRAVRGPTDSASRVMMIVGRSC